MTDVDPEEYRRVADAYWERFAEPPPPYQDDLWPTADISLPLMKKALERGSPITDEDYPDLPPGIVYDPEES